MPRHDMRHVANIEPNILLCTYMANVLWIFQNIIISTDNLSSPELFSSYPPLVLNYPHQFYLLMFNDNTWFFLFFYHMTFNWDIFGNTLISIKFLIQL